MRGVLNRDVLRQIAIIAAKEAGKIILEGFGKETKYKPKGRTDIVTPTDKKSQNKIIQIIKKKFPDHAFLSEEAPKIKGKSDYLWIIDPLDGTSNHRAGITFFCVSICLSYKKNPILGVVYDPLHKEMFSAEKNKGAFLNGKKIKVSKQKSLNKSMIGADSGHINRKKSVQKMGKLVDFVRGIRWQGAAALSLSYVACGRIEAYMTANTTAWDSCAGCLIIEEAGGKTTEINGKKRTIFSKSLLATNKSLHNKILNKIK